MKFPIQNGMLLNREIDVKWRPPRKKEIKEE